MSSSIPSSQILTAHAQPFRGARDLAFCLKVPLDSLLVWASSEGSGETARMRRLAWTFAARIGDKYQIRLARPKSHCWSNGVTRLGSDWTRVFSAHMKTHCVLGYPNTHSEDSDQPGRMSTLDVQPDLGLGCALGSVILFVLQWHGSNVFFVFSLDVLFIRSNYNDVYPPRPLSLSLSLSLHYVKVLKFPCSKICTSIYAIFCAIMSCKIVTWALNKKLSVCLSVCL